MWRSFAFHGRAIIIIDLATLLILLFIMQILTQFIHIFKDIRR